jgi:transposase
MRKRAELLTHVQHTTSQYTVPEIGKKIADTANRPGGAARFADPAVPKRVEVALALLDYSDARLQDLALAIVKTAKPHEATTLYVLHTGPGIGQSLRRVLVYARHASARFPRGQDCVSYCRVVQCAKDSAGKRDGTSGTQSGNAALTRVFSDAAVLCLRTNPTGPKSL